MKRWLAAMMALVLLLALLPVSSMAAQYATVRGGWLRLRSYASFDAQTLASYYTGTVVEVLGKTGNWYHVRLSDGNTGYMYGDYLTLGSGTPSGTPGTGNAIVISHNGYGVRLRVGPGTNYRVINKFPVGTPATILESGKNWCKISIEGYVGYMMSQFLSGNGAGGSGGTISYVGDATIWSSNGYGVRLRSGPGKGYSKIGVYSVGTQVKIISKGAVWDYIQVGSRCGYMMNEFLIYNNNYNVNGVTINNTNPVVGNVLAVQSVTPSTATVTYEWLVTPEGGTETVKGTSAAYLVTDADVGATIRLKVTGAGSYKGSAYSTTTAKVVKTGVLEKVELNGNAPYVGDTLKATITPASATVNYFWSVDGVQKSNASAYVVEAADAGKTITLTVEGKYPFSGIKSVTTSPVKAQEAPVITTTTLASGAYQTAYTAQLNATGGGTLKWTIINGALPVGLSMSQNGEITGIPSESGSKTFTAQVSNGMGVAATREFTITIGKAKVSLTDIAGVTAPVKDAAAVVATTDNDQYTGTVTWSPALTDGKFAANTAYTATISLAAKANYTFTGLTANSFKVVGSNSGSVSCIVGTDGSTATVTAVFPKTAAENAVKLSKPTITGISQQADSSWIISWSAVDNASGYMFREVSSTATGWHQCTGTSYTFQNKPIAATYQVYALGDGVAYDDSDVAEYVYNVPVKLGAPTTMTIVENNGVWTANWDAVVNASGYRFQQVGGSGWHDCTGSSYTFVNKPETATYQVYAVGNGTSYENSDVFSYDYTAPVTPPAPVPAMELDAPTGLSIQESGGVWTATWNTVSGASSYRFQQVGGSGWHDCSSASYTFQNKPVTGEYQVYAVGDGVNYTDSAVASLSYTEPVVTPVTLGTPAFIGVSEAGGAWTITWTSVDHASGYRFRQTNGSGTWYSCSSASYTFVNQPNSGDTYEVYAVGDGTTYLDGSVASFTY